MMSTQDFIDFKNIKSVLNYDCPYNPINYIHKIGRTGRAGRTGNAYTFIVDEDIPKIKNISKMIKNSVILINFRQAI